MRLTSPLLKQHLGRLIKQHWFAHGKQIPFETFVEDALAKKGIHVVDPKEIITPFKPLQPRINLQTENFLIQRPLALDETHPDWKEKYCWQFNDNELLVEGTDQAQVLTKTIMIKNGMPDKLEAIMNDCETSKEINQFVEKTIKSSNIFDAEQKKLPIVKDPTRPAWNFPRDYGITQVKKSSNLSQRMIQLCEIICGSNIVKQRQIIDNGIVQVPITKESKPLLLNMNIDLMIASKKSLPINEVSDNFINDLTLPNLYPLTSVAGLQKMQIYNLVNIYPISKESQWINPHTIFFYHDPDHVKNITELPIKENQLLGRSLIKAFTIGAGCARQKYGDNFNDDLPEPMTIQCVQTNGQSFHFSVFQLNTLNINDSSNGKINYWWSMPQIDLFKIAKYEAGKPILEGYNPEVFQRILAFYKNQ